MAAATGPERSETTDLDVGKLYPLARKVLTPIFHGLWKRSARPRRSSAEVLSQGPA